MRYGLLHPERKREITQTYASYFWYESHWILDGQYYVRYHQMLCASCTHIALILAIWCKRSRSMGDFHALSVGNRTFLLHDNIFIHIRHNGINYDSVRAFLVCRCSRADSVHTLDNTLNCWCRRLAKMVVLFSPNLPCDACYPIFNTRWNSRWCETSIRKRRTTKRNLGILQSRRWCNCNGCSLFLWYPCNCNHWDRYFCLPEKVYSQNNTR